ncbi:MAG: hypothetical protein NC122_08850 [Faecalibacterium sp.]|nr:hypothetical protein [Ruminococcus sp.]MCM1392742.1 hypothetical protein [Ruminococcus sp.]MCM1486302.1 hypothetical protein [Faecalibacterium sp.]
MNGFITVLITALYAMLIQNLIFTAAYGVSETIKIAKRPKYLFMCTASVAFFSISSAAFCNLLDKIRAVSELSAIMHFALYVLVLASIYLIIGFFSIHVLKANKKYMSSLGICAFNSLVLAVPMLNFKANYNLLESIGNGIGAALAFLIAVLLINAGIRHIASNKNIPEIFRGTPSLIIYVALLSLAFSCFSGEALFV